MAETVEKESSTRDYTDVTLAEAPSAVDEAAAIPKGTIDPVYEAKARVLNHAVCSPPPQPLPRKYQRS
jgi:hypothetical protein